MKKILLLAIFIFVLIFILRSFLFTQKNNTDQSSLSLPSITQTTPFNWPYQITTPYDNQTLKIIYSEIPKSAKLSLIPNFSDKENGETIVNKHGCNYAVNAGFYQENGQPLGLFIANGIKYGEKTVSNIANGFFWQDKDNNRAFGKNPPDRSGLDWIFQTGPLITPGNYQLKMVADEKARRILIASDKQNRLYLMAIFEENNNFSGPFLSDLPAIFTSSSIQEVIPLTSILNLDGGAASFFYAQEKNTLFSLSEITSVGSLICVKK